jgi:hypothetical protein
MTQQITMDQKDLNRMIHKLCDQRDEAWAEANQLRSALHANANAPTAITSRADAANQHLQP